MFQIPAPALRIGTGEDPSVCSWNVIVVTVTFGLLTLASSVRVSGPPPKALPLISSPPAKLKFPELQESGHCRTGQRGIIKYHQPVIDTCWNENVIAVNKIEINGRV